MMSRMKYELRFSLKITLISGVALQVRLLVLPNLELYLRLLAPEMMPETQPNEMKRYEAWRVYGALQVFLSHCFWQLRRRLLNLAAIGLILAQDW